MFVLRLRRPGADLEASEGRCKNLLQVFLKRFSFPPNRHVIGAVLARAVALRSWNLREAPEGSHGC